ncbi:hypothetical protein, partial [Carnobacterium sp.]|uniref:hypothetical protein n=1 Tax=Carnobacterium sp. TaxID=48221 RepID=UPI003AA0079E
IQFYKGDVCVFSFTIHFIEDFKSAASSIKFMYDLLQEIPLRESSISATKQKAETENSQFFCRTDCTGFEPVTL